MIKPRDLYNPLQHYNSGGWYGLAWKVKKKRNKEISCCIKWKPRRALLDCELFWWLEGTQPKFLPWIRTRTRDEDQEDQEGCNDWLLTSCDPLAPILDLGFMYIWGFVGLPARPGAWYRAWHLCLADGDGHYNICIVSYAWRVKGLSIVFGSILLEPNVQTKLFLVSSEIGSI